MHVLIRLRIIVPNYHVILGNSPTCTYAVAITKLPVAETATVSLQTCTSNPCSDHGTASPSLSLNALH